MNYKQAMKWGRKHPKGTRQPMLFSTHSGFWPSGSWIEGVMIPYVAACGKIGEEPMEAKALYTSCMRGRMMENMTADDRAEYTQLRRLRAEREEAAQRSSLANSP